MPKPTNPTLPPEYTHAALLVIDVQDGMFHKSTPVYRAEQLIHNINHLVERAHQCGAPVVYVQHCGQRDLVRGTPGWQLHPDLRPLDTDPIVHKEQGNAFENTTLSEILNARQVGRVVVTGMVTHGCVKATCLGARELGYPVTLVTDAHSSYSQDAAALIEKWHANLSKEGVTLLPTVQVQFEKEP